MQGNNSAHVCVCVCVCVCMCVYVCVLFAHAIQISLVPLPVSQMISPCHVYWPRRGTSAAHKPFSVKVYIIYIICRANVYNNMYSFLPFSAVASSPSSFGRPFFFSLSLLCIRCRDLAVHILLLFILAIRIIYLLPTFYFFSFVSHRDYISPPTRAQYVYAHT